MGSNYCLNNGRLGVGTPLDGGIKYWSIAIKSEPIITKVNGECLEYKIVRDPDLNKYDKKTKLFL